jgi:hypothetical protein
MPLQWQRLIDWLGYHTEDLLASGIFSAHDAFKGFS